ncbi:MAG: type II toxin-antitoxin system HicB family antitoxin [Nitrososphaerales archaeon]
MAIRTFTVAMEKDKETGLFTVQYVELPGVISQGKSEKEALANIKEAIQLVLDYLEDKAGVKKPGKKLVEVVV